MTVLKPGRIGAVLVGALAMLAATVMSGAVGAEEPVETAIRSWIAAVDTSPDWSATYSDLAFDSASGTATLSDLVVRSASPGFELGFASISVAGFSQTSDGSFKAHRVAATGGTLAAGSRRIVVSDIAIDDFSMPEGGGFIWIADRPFTSMVKAYGPLAKVRMAAARIGSLALVEEAEGTASRIRYDGITIANWAGGKIGSIAAGPLRLDAPSQNPLIIMKVAETRVRDMDLTALLHVYDPDSFVGGVGDQVWLAAIGSADYRDTVIEIPGASVAVGAVSIADVKVRQPPRSFASVFDGTMLGDRADDGKEPGRRALGVASAFAVGRFAMSPIDVDAIGFDRVHFDGISLADLSIDGLGELAIDGFEGAIGGEARVAIGRLALGGVVFPASAAILAAIRDGIAGRDVDVSALAPTLAVIEAGGVDIDVTGIPPTRLGRLRIDLGHYIGPAPTSIAVEVADADFATSMMAHGRVRGLLEGFGYERMRVDSSVRLTWNEDAGTTVVDGFRLAIEDLGTLSGNAAFSGPTRAEIERIDSIEEIASAVSLERGTLTFADDSIVGRALAGQAARLKVDPEKFREQFARGLPFMLSFLGDRDFQTKAAPALQTFIKTPGSITFMAAPAAPIAVSAIVAAARASPFSLPNLLALTVASEAGPEPARVPPAEPEPVTEAVAGPAATEDATTGADLPTAEMRRTIEPALSPPIPAD